MKLTRGQRNSLFAGGCPRIAGKEETAPVEPGHVFRLSTRLELFVVAIRAPKAGGWSLEYVVIDRRDPVRCLRRTPGIGDGGFAEIRRSFDEFGFPGEPTGAALKAAAQESAYTSVPTPLTTWQRSYDAGEAVQEEVQKHFTTQARERDDQRERRRRDAWQRRSLAQRAADLEALAALPGVDISRELRLVEHAMSKAREKTERALRAAARLPGSTAQGGKQRE